MTAQIHTFIHHDPHIHHPALHHPHPHRILSHRQRDHLDGWSGLLWTDYLNADAFAVTRDLAAEQEEEEMMEYSSEEEEISQMPAHEKQKHNQPQRPLSPESKPKEEVEVNAIGVKNEEEHGDYCTLHDHPARPLSPSLLPTAKVDTHKHDYCTLHDHPCRPLSPPLLSRARVEVHKEEHPDYCTSHNHPARPLSPPLPPRSKPEDHHDYCTLHQHPDRPLSPALMPHEPQSPTSDPDSEASISYYEDWILEAASTPSPDYCTQHKHPERPLSSALFHRSPALKGSEPPQPEPQLAEDNAGISHYEDWMDEVALDRAAAEQREFDRQERAAARRALMDEVNDLIDEANEIEEEMWSDAPATPTSEHSKVFDEPEDVEPGIVAGSYNRRCSTGTMEDIEEACCSCKNENCSAAYLAQSLKVEELKLHPALGISKNVAKVPMGAW